MASRVAGSLRSPLRAVPIATVVGASLSCPLCLSVSLLGSGDPVLWVVVSTVGWMVGPAGAIGRVVVVGSTVSVVAIAVPVVSEGCFGLVGTGMVEDCDMAVVGIAG